jgi:hypothetical protein
MREVGHGGRVKSPPLSSPASTGRHRDIRARRAAGPGERALMAESPSASRPAGCRGHLGGVDPFVPRNSRSSREKVLGATQFPVPGCARIEAQPNLPGVSRSSADLASASIRHDQQRSAAACRVVPPQATASWLTTRTRPGCAECEGLGCGDPQLSWVKGPGPIPAAIPESWRSRCRDSIDRRENRFTDDLA